MLKVKYDLGGDFFGLCNPILTISEDTSNEVYVVSLGINIAVGEAKELAEMFKKMIPEEFSTVEEFRNAMDKEYDEPEDE